MEDDDDNTVLADILSLKISKENKRNSVTNWGKQHSPWLYQNKDKRQEQLQASLNQLQYLHQQQLKTMMRYSSYKNNDYNKNSNNSNRSSSSSNNSSISSSNSSSSSSSSSSKRNSYTFQLSPSSSNSSFQSQKRYPSSLGKKIKRAFSVTRSMSEKKPNQEIQDIILPDSPTSSVSSRKTNRLTKYFSLLPLPASSTTCRKISFSSTVIVHETFSRAEYNRRSDNTYTCQNLTPELALDIKKELNNYKLNHMHVHPQSRQFTHFFI
ncbi:hypothetical protein RMCBS344292_08109 [Rhizopus microsporus]|nr:hypothetical protein RMCBS344292_08109 [Rhizopus microsporus]